MSQFYTDPSRKNDLHALPNAEVFWQTHKQAVELMGDDSYYADDEGNMAGWYWWACFPGCLPDGDPIGPFATEAEAIADAQQDLELEA